MTRFWDKYRYRLVLSILLILWAWEILFISGFSRISSFSSPSEIAKLFTDLNFLRKITVFLILLNLLALLGLVIGITLGEMVFKVRWLAVAFISFENTAVWIPFLMPWALPIWSVLSNHPAVTITAIRTASIIAVSLWVCLYYLSLRMFANKTWSSMLSQGVEQSLFSLCSCCIGCRLHLPSRG